MTPEEIALFGLGVLEGGVGHKDTTPPATMTITSVT